jgi:hypothetical protein
MANTKTLTARINRAAAHGVATFTSIEAANAARARRLPDLHPTVFAAFIHLGIYQPDVDLARCALRRAGYDLNRLD